MPYIESNGHYMVSLPQDKQGLRSWFEVNAKLPSATLAAYIIHDQLGRLLSQSHKDLSDPTIYSNTKGTSTVTLNNFMIL